LDPFIKEGGGGGVLGALEPRNFSVKPGAKGLLLLGAQTNGILE